MMARIVSLFAAGIVAGLLHVTAAEADTLTVQKPVEFAQDSMVRDAVRDECQLQTKLPDFVAEAVKASFEVEFAADPEAVKSGKALSLEMVQLDEQGNAFTGRSKSLTIKGELRENGKLIGSFRARRSTMGGFMGGYKGNCGFFGRCAKTLGEDVAKWLHNPGMNDVINN